MNRIILVILLLTAWLPAYSQLPAVVEMKIVKAEDARRYDGELENLFSDKSSDVRARAALAAGRIGDEAAAAPLTRLLDDASADVRAMATFALGEIESLKSADAIIALLNKTGEHDNVRARAVEAAGKIAAAHAGPPNTPVDKKDPKVVDLGNSLLDALEAEEAKREKQNELLIRLGLAAALRARPEGAESVVVLYLTNLDPSVRADAANTMSRIRGKSANVALRAMLMSDENAVARANAARALGAAEDKESVNILITAATEDDDLRVRVSAIRSLALLRDPFAVEKLLDHGEKLLSAFRKGKKPNTEPAEKSELLEIAAALGRLIPKTNDARSIRFLDGFREADGYRSPEAEIAAVRVAPVSYLGKINLVIEGKGYSYPANPRLKKPSANWQVISAISQGIGAAAGIELNDDARRRADAVSWLEGILQNSSDPKYDFASFTRALPDVLRAYAGFKTAEADQVLRASLLHPDPMVRAASAALMADRPAAKENIDALKSAFAKAMVADKKENDAHLAILDALFKLDPKESAGIVINALDSPDHLVRRKGIELLRQMDVKQLPGVPTFIESALKQDKDKVLPYTPIYGTRLGQVLNTAADYRRAIARRNGMVRAVVTTGKGSFTIELLPDDAPLTVDNFVKLANARYFNGLEVHRVVPNFVMQDGDPRGDGNGGPGWSIRCEINMVPFERGAVGMALSGKDTGGSQWFATHSPQPHLDGGYTVFGKVNEMDMKVVDNIVRGNKILSVKIIEGGSSPKKIRK